MNIEQKFVFVNPQKDMILEWVEHACARDGKYYIGVVSSLYFDTPGLEHYLEKRNSDYVKSKIRLRWYEDVERAGEAFDVTCFVEMKRKHGVSRQKERSEILIDSHRLRDNPFDDEKILEIPNRVFDLDYIPPGILVPMLLIQYDRHRYVDPESGSRIAVDTNIRCTRTNAAYVPGVPPVHLEAGVLEVKGPDTGLPRVLKPMAARLTIEAFSKYARCWESLMQPLGRRL